MLPQRKSTAPSTTTSNAPRLIYAKYRGVCKCGRGFIAGEQIEFDPVGRHKRCRQCIQSRHSSQQYANRRVVDFDSYRGMVMRLKQIAELPRPLAPKVKDEYWRLMREISTAPESSRSVKQFLQSIACCPSESCFSHDHSQENQSAENHSAESTASEKLSQGSSRRFLVTLLESKQCVHCLQRQHRGELVLMEFPSRKVHCIWCECTSL
jgi:hypothetical protein